MNKKYQIIYADPPWSYQNGGVPQGGVNAQYQTMTDSDICNLPIWDISDNNSLLFMWATFPKLKEGIAVIEAWGFQYKTCAFTWVKTNPKQELKSFFGIGYYTKSNAEICLLGVRGKGHSLVKNNSVSQLIFSPRLKHSEKPNEARKKIIQLCGDIPRIELFARQKVEGWDVIGNDIDGKDIRETLEEMVK